MPIKVTFRALRSGRVWDAVFDLGTDKENAYAAVKAAWDHCSEIVYSISQRNA